MKYNEQDMAKLIVEVETEFKEYLTKAEQNEVESTPEVEAAAEEVTLEKAEGEFDYDEEDISEMNEMYASMSKSEKEAHYSAIKKTLFAESEEAESEDLNKSEVTETEDSNESEDEEKVLLKSEIETIKGNLESSTKENDELKKNIETLTNIVSKIVKRAPARKAVTQIGNVQVLKKTEEPVVEDESAVDYSTMKKSEINKILTSKIRSGEIKKSEDKENINKYCYGQIELDKIKYLL